MNAASPIIVIWAAIPGAGKWRRYRDGVLVGAISNLGVEMSSRTIVSLGVWILFMVLIGTLTVGMALAFYVLLTLFFALVVGVLMLITRTRSEL